MWQKEGKETSFQMKRNPIIIVPLILSQLKQCLDWNNVSTERNWEVKVETSQQQVWDDLPQSTLCYSDSDSDRKKGTMQEWRRDGWCVIDIFLPEKHMAHLSLSGITSVTRESSSPLLLKRERDNPWVLFQSMRRDETTMKETWQRKIYPKSIPHIKMTDNLTQDTEGWRRDQEAQERKSIHTNNTTTTCVRQEDMRSQHDVCICFKPDDDHDPVHLYLYIPSSFQVFHHFILILVFCSCLASLVALINEKQDHFFSCDLCLNFLW